MKEQLITFETAVLAKKKGFDNYTNYSYKNGLLVPFSYQTEGRNKNRLQAPTQSLLQKWLREKYMIYVSIERFYDLEVLYYTVFIEDSKNKCSKALKSKNNPSHSPFAFSKYEEALEKGLQEGLKLT